MITNIPKVIYKGIKNSMIDIAMFTGILSYVLGFEGWSPDPTLVFVLYEAFIATLGIDS